MKKLEIDTCLKCHYLVFSDFLDISGCGQKEKDIGTFPRIPPWCPLPDVKEEE